MAKNAYHPSIEGAQHGAKSLEQFLDYAKAAGAAGAQPSNYMLGDGKGGFRKTKEIKEVFESRGMKLDGISAHCPFWVHTSIWSGTKSGNPFIAPDVLKLSPDKIEAWHEDYLLKLMDLASDLGVKSMPMFWGVAFGWELATGYPWGFWAGPDANGGKFDLLKEGQERFVQKTAKLRAHAGKLGIYLCHEIHPGTGASTADDFNMLVEICNNDPCLGVNADPSHCWEGESWETRFLKVGSRIYAAHVKNFVIRPRSASADDAAKLAEARHAVHRPRLRRPEHAALCRVAAARRLSGPLLQAAQDGVSTARRRSRERAQGSRLLLG
jgi:sugar phosphate isomerase/epimerase